MRKVVRRCNIADFLRAGDGVLTTSMAWERRELFLATGRDSKRACILRESNPALRQARIRDSTRVRLHTYEATMMG